MTVTVTTDRTGPLTADSADPLPFTFQAISAAEIEVYLDDVLVDLNDYAVVLNGDGTGSVIPNDPWAGEVFIVSAPTFQQPHNFNRFVPLYPDQVVPPLDRLAKSIIALKNRLLRGLPQIGTVGTGAAAITPRIEAGQLIWDFTIPQGDPGENGAAGSSSGFNSLFAELAGANIPPIITAVRTAGYSIPGIGGAMYVADAAVDAAYVAAHPLWSFQSADNRGWRLAETTVTPHMFGGIENEHTGNRATGVPAYVVTVTDATAAVQAVFDYVEHREDVAVVGDFRGSWGLKDDDADGYCIRITQPYWLRREYIMGEFIVLTGEEGFAVFKIEEFAYHHKITGDWQIWGQPDGVAGGSYASRTFRHAMELRAGSLWDIDRIYARGFLGWAVYMPAIPIDATYNQNIGLKINRLKASDCGSVPAIGSNRFSSTYSGGVYTGGASSNLQRSVLILDTASAVADHFFLNEEPWVVINGEPYQVMAVDEATNKISIFPWLPAGQEVNGTLYLMSGGGLLSAGSDTARIKVEYLDCITCGLGFYTRGLYGITVHEALVQTGGAAMAIGVEGGNTIGNVVLGAHWEGTQFDLITRNENGSNTYIAGLTMAGDDGANFFKNCRALAANDGAALNTQQSFPGVTFNAGGVDYHSGNGGASKSRLNMGVLSNDPRWNHVRLVSNDAVNLTLKYYEPVDRFFRNHFTAVLEVIGTDGDAPIGDITITLDAADSAAGIKLNGSTAPYVLAGASGPLRLEFWLDTNGAVKDWKVFARAGAPVALNGREIINNGGTRVIGADSGGYNVKKLAAGGAYDAGAVSSGAVTGDFVMRAKRISGSVVYGVSLDADANNGTGAIVGFGADAGSQYAYSYGGVLGATFDPSHYVFLTYTQSTDTFRFYHGSSSNLGEATEVAGTAIIAPGLGATWFFDSSLNAANSEFEVIFDIDEDSVPPIENGVNTDGSIIARGVMGYGITSGGSVVQATNKSTGVTLDKLTGQITLNNAALAAATSVGFTLTNNKIAADDEVTVWIKSGGTVNSYVVGVDQVAAGSCHIHLRNISAGSLGEAVVLGFAVRRANIT